MTFWSAVAERSGDTALDETNPASNADDTDRKAAGQIGEEGRLRRNGPARVQRAESVDGQRTPETELRRLTLRSATRTLQRNVPASASPSALFPRLRVAAVKIFYLDLLGLGFTRGAAFGGRRAALRAAVARQRCAYVHSRRLRIRAAATYKVALRNKPFRIGQTPDFQPRCVQAHHATLLLPRFKSTVKPLLPLLPLVPQ